MTNPPRVALVFGLPGAGKSTLITDAIANDGRYLRLSGGSLINAALSDEDRDRLRKLDSNEILLNQEKLVIGFNNKLKALSGKTVLFDGHCLVKDGNKTVEIPQEIIRRLHPDLIVFVDVSPKIIAERRSNDSNRPDREKENPDQLQAQRELQISICKKYATYLKIPLVILPNPSSDDLLKALKKNIT